MKYVVYTIYKIYNVIFPNKQTACGREGSHLKFLINCLVCIEEKDKSENEDCKSFLIIICL